MLEIKMIPFQGDSNSALKAALTGLSSAPSIRPNHPPISQLPLVRPPVVSKQNVHQPGKSDVPLTPSAASASYLPKQQLSVVTSFENFKNVRHLSRSFSTLSISNSLSSFPVTLYCYLGLVPTYKEYLQTECVWNKPLPPFKPKNKRVPTVKVPKVERTGPPSIFEESTQEAPSSPEKTPLQPDQSLPPGINQNPKPTSNDPLDHQFLKPCSVVLKRIKFSPTLIKSLNKIKRREERRKRKHAERALNRKHKELKDQPFNKNDSPEKVAPIRLDKSLSLPSPEKIIKGGNGLRPDFRKSENPDIIKPLTYNGHYPDKIQLINPNLVSPSPISDPITINADKSSNPEERSSSTFLGYCARAIPYPNSCFKNTFSLSKKHRKSSKKRKEVGSHKHGSVNKKRSEDKHSNHKKNHRVKTSKSSGGSNHSESRSQTSSPKSVGQRDPAIELRKSIAILNPNLNGILNESSNKKNISVKTFENTPHVLNKSSGSPVKTSLKPSTECDTDSNLPLSGKVSDPRVINSTPVFHQVTGTPVRSTIQSPMSKDICTVDLKSNSVKILGVNNTLPTS